MAKQNIYEIITNKFIKEMSNGIIPWKRPWNVGSSDYMFGNLAYNYVTGKPYSLINQMLLGFQGGAWITFNQCAKLGGKVKTGEKSTMITFWSLFVKEETDDNGEISIKKIPCLRTYNVFNAETQCEGLKKREIAKPDATLVVDNEFTPIEKAEALADDYISREHINFFNSVGSNRAFYQPATDKIVVPDPSSFEYVEEYYSTLFHEIAHSTGHETRLNRCGVIDNDGFGSKKYSFEELVAELSSAFTLSRLGIANRETEQNSTAYLQSWITAFKNNPKMLIQASSKAEKATKYVFNEIPEEGEMPETPAA